VTFRSRISSGLYAELAGPPHAAREARALVGDLLGDDHPSVDDAALIASELVSNAIAHSRSGEPAASSPSRSRWRLNLATSGSWSGTPADSGPGPDTG